MIGEARQLCHASLFSYAEGIQDLFAGRESMLAEAVACDFAEFAMWHRRDRLSPPKKK